MALSFRPFHKLQHHKRHASQGLCDVVHSRQHLQELERVSGQLVALGFLLADGE